MLQLSICLLAAALGQAPAAETGWLDQVPASADIVIRTKGLESTRDDLVAMLKAMSPALGAQAEPALKAQLDQLKQMHGESAASQPFLALIRAVRPEDPNSPPFAVVVKSDNYKEVITALNGGKAPEFKPEEGGFDSFAGPQDATWYSAKGNGFVAFGPDRTLVAGFAKSEGKTLAKGIAPGIQKQLQGGDLGLYVNIKALNDRYGEQIAQAKEQFLGMLEQAGNQGGNAAMMQSLKPMYAAVFDSVKDLDAFALSFDFAGEGLTLDGDLAVKPDSGAARAIAEAKSGDASGLAGLSADAAYYAYMNIDAKAFQGLQRMGMNMLTSGKPSPELNAALARIEKMGRFESIGAVSMGNGMRSFNLSTVADPKAVIDATEASMKAMKGNDSPFNLFKEINVTPGAETYAGFTFSRVEMKLDAEKFAKLQPNNPAAGDAMIAMYGGDTINNWYGFKGQQMLQVTAPNWEKARALIDANTKGQNTIGQSKAFTALRSKLPKDVTVLGLFSAQGLVKQMAAQFGAAMNNPNAKPPADMPNEPAFVGVSLSLSAPTTFDFHLVVPSAVGPVIEKGLVPLFQGIRGGGNP